MFVLLFLHGLVGDLLGGEFRVKPHTLSIIYNRDGQTSGPRTDGDADFLAIKLV
jgi:hypothetical protein